MEKLWYCFDSAFNELNENEYENVKKAYAVYIVNPEAFKKFCKALGLITNGIDDNDECGYYWDNACMTWVSLSDTDNDKLVEIIQKKEYGTNDKNELYDLYFESTIFDETIKSNSKPISLEEVMEAITLLQKPCLFGDTITQYRIVKHEN